MPPSLPVVRVVADQRNVGKTWLARALIEELTRRGHLVGAVKHSHHVLPLDKPGSDTAQFAEAGAARVVFAAADGVLTRMGAAIPLKDAVEELVGRVDLAIVEGFKSDELGATLRIEAASGLATLTSMDGHRVATAPRDDVGAFAGAIVGMFELAGGGTEVLRARLRKAAAAHGHMCPGVTLGVRMAM
ncbi:MAG: molybdopterin-guanine dinucleotide biosynthesis protein B, partial [Dehalococcoidia bacterium]|nr:molybdopterin-guanine dinucleotide biosynthesis protein B [Dehalococcoidia bacterium]